MKYSSKTLHILKPLISEVDDIHFLKNIDSICVEIEKNSENKKTLCKKANDILGKNFPKKDISCDTNASGRTCYGLDKDDRMQDLFFEILSYEYLNKNGYSNIKFLSGEGLPDLQANKNGQIFFVESKCIHRPKGERDRLMLAPIDTDGVPEVSVNDVDDISLICGGLKNKFQSDAKNAKSNFEKVKAKKQNRILLFSFEPSIGAIIRQHKNPDYVFFDNSFLLECGRTFKIGEVIQL